MTLDPRVAAEMKARERQGWSNAAPSWLEHDEMLTALAAPVTTAMIERAEIRRGMRVLDVACGTGHPAIPIAQHVGADGSVVATDFAEPMVAVARDKARAQASATSSSASSTAKSSTSTWAASTPRPCGGA
jgi:ubiquinone/menaquinone biosynthesis C-methylase UbiE